MTRSNLWIQEVIRPPRHRPARKARVLGRSPGVHGRFAGRCGPPELFAIPDRAAVERRLAEVPPRRPGQSWHLLALSVLLSGAWREPEPDGLPDVEVLIPVS
ncbi:hypothetical protein [Actinomadura chokoriensis]|uniref:Uncharacterized protein n=1 Tax=Actinomadura chokoriensis TaxID=454156 RepID=A0ABV4QT26_9ACTN